MGWLGNQIRVSRAKKKARVDTKIQAINSKSYKSKDDWNNLESLNAISAGLAERNKIASERALNPKTKQINKGSKSVHNEVNGMKVEEANLLKVNKTTKSAPAHKAITSKAKKK